MSGQPTHHPRVHVRNDKFLINCCARSGSTLLVHLLRSHPGVLCHGEPFGPADVGHLAGRFRDLRKETPAANDVLRMLRDRQPERFLYDCLFDAQGRKAVGFKYKADESQLRRFKKVTKILASDSDIKVINLDRQDRVAQFVSHQFVLQQTGVTLLRADQPQLELEPMHLDPALCVREVRAAKTRYDKARAAFAGHRSHDIAYEELLEPAAQEPLQEFLGLQTRELQTPTRKVIDRPLEDIVLNLDELRAAVSRAGLA